MMIMANTKIKRKTYVINKGFQFRFIATFLVLVVISLLIFSAGFAVYYWVRYLMGDNIFDEFILVFKRVEIVDQKGELTDVEQEIGATNRFEIVVLPLLLNNILIMVVISIIGIFYSHKIAGPVYRIGKEIEKAIGGEAGIRLKLRKGDKLHELANEINLLLEELDKYRTGK
jgi:hypothetical protein